MGSSVKEKIDVVVQIDARAYYEYPYALKPQAAETVGAINAYYKGKKKHILLMTPWQGGHIIAGARCAGEFCTDIGILRNLRGVR